MNEKISSIEQRIKNKRALYLKKPYSKPNILRTKTINRLFTNTLISIILVLAVAIFTNIKEENKTLFKTKIFQDTVLFTKINNLYAKYFGDVIPSKVNKTTTVFGETLKYTNIENNDTYYTVTLSSNIINALESGIVVFMGEKDNLGETVIIQGIDGVDIWYSNISPTNLTLYDYISENTILGEAKDDKIYLSFIENGQNISYEKYLN